MKTKVKKYVMTILLTFVVFIIFSSCRFSKPVFYKFQHTDTIKFATPSEIWKYYKYPRILPYFDFFRPSIVLNNLLIIKSSYLDDGTYIKEIYKNKPNRKCYDCRIKHIIKTLYFKNDLLTKKEKVISIDGFSGKMRYNKTFIYNENGKLIDKINVKKEEE